MAGEHIGGGVRAFLIADIRGYTSFTQERGDLEAARLASRFAALVRDCVDAAGGRVVELRGDEALCVFDSPRQALRTAVSLQGRFADATREDPSLPMRVGIGLDAGEAVAVEQGFRGAALNLAARLCALAGPWEVLAGEGIVLMAGRVDGLAYSDRGRIRVKGVRDPVRVQQLQFELDLPPAPAPVSQPPFFKRRRRSLVILAGVAVAAAGVGAFFVARGGEEQPPETVGDSAALLEPMSGRLLAQFPVGATPIAVVSDDSAAWTLDADGETISRIDPNGRRPLTKAAPGTPAGLAVGGGLLWVAFVERDRGGTKAGIASLDPSTLSARSRTVLPGVAPDYGDVPAVAYAGDAVWVSGPSDLLRRIDPKSGHVTATLRLGSEALALAGGLGSLWATAGRDTLLRIDPEKARITKRIHLPTPGVGALAVGAGSVWVADPLAGVLWRVRPGTNVTHTVPIGLGASGVAFGGDSIWVASGVDGQVARVDASTEKVTTFPVGNAPLAVSVSPSGIWIAVASAGGRSIAPTPKLLGLDTLPAGTCSGAVYGGSGRPDALIVSDLPTQSVEAPVTLAMVQAVEFVLRRHHFRAGSYGIAYQACDDATVAAGSFTAEKCAANAKTYAAAAAVIGVIGPENSGCATSQIAIANGAKSGPLAFVTPTASYVGLTRSGPGVGPGEPQKYYPTGIRNFARVYPPDDAQGAAGAVLANRRGVKRAYVFESDPNEQYGVALGDSFAKAARALGIHVDGPQSPSPKRGGYGSLAHRLRSGGVDGIYLAGLNDERSAEFIRAARAAIGRRLVVIAPDAFLPASNQVHAIGKAAIGMYVTGGVVSDPLNQLPPAGRRFAREFSATQSRRNVNFYAPYAAQAAEVLLQAIAHSDGTRASVTRQLLRVRIRDGIFGSIAFDRSGDLTSNLFPIFRVERAAPDVLYPEDRVVTVISAPLRPIG